MLVQSKGTPEFIDELKGAPYTCLVALSQADRPVQLKWLAEQTGYSLGSIASALRALSDHGLVKAVPDAQPSDNCDLQNSTWKLSEKAPRITLKVIQDPDQPDGQMQLAVNMPVSSDDSRTAQQAWESAVYQLKHQVPIGIYKKYIRPLRLATFDVQTNTLILSAPSSEDCQWLRSRLTPIVEQILSGLADRPLSVRFVSIKLDKP